MNAPLAEFGDLPPNPRARGASASKWQPTVDALKSRPREWARVLAGSTRIQATNLASNVRRGGGAWHPAGAFQSTTRGNDVWARFVGGDL